VTALAFSKDLLFAGEGPVLRIYRRYDNQLHETFDVFPSQAIHGIVVYSEGLIIWGGNLVASYLFTADKASLRRPASFFEASDWILDISVAPETPGGTQKAALVTAHNALLLLDLKHLTTGLQDLTSSSRCILYSAHIHWTDSEHILVASGTVFGDIIVWTCILQQSGPCSSTLHHLLTGHEGSIFGVHIFEPSAGPSRLLASCSDDRTLRIWDISLLPETATTSQAVTDLTSIRETGFGLNIADVLPDTAVGGTCIATGWGHSSRIWGFKVVPSPDPQIISHIVSFGEDASRQLWSLRQTAPDEHSLSHIEGSTSHAGMNIWSWATVQDTPQQVIIASGGADGSIALESKSLPFTQESDYTRTWSMQDFSASSLGQSKSGPRDKLRTFAFLDSTKLLVTTNEGNIFLLAKAADQNTTMNWLCREERLRGYSVITSISSLSIAFLAGVDGSVIMYDGHGFYDLFKTNSKTSALFAHRLPSSKVPQARIGLLVANVEAKTALFSRFDMSSVCDATRAPEYTSSCQLLLPKAFVVTSFVITATGQDSKHTILLLGSRNGSIAIYLLDNLTNNREDTSVAHSYLLHKAHSIDAVTDLAWYDNHVFSVGRDGTFAVHQLVTSDSQLSLRLINQTVLPLGSNVEGVGIDEHNHHVLAWGFSGKRFVVYDVNDESEIMSVGCGGASRSWKFEPRETLQESHFGWIEASQLCLVSQGEQRKQGVNRGSHGREIKAVAVCPIKQRNAGVLFATGSEDTDIKLFTYSRLDEVPNFKCLRTLRKHNTGIRHLEWSSDGRYLFSSGGFEEFVVWRIEAAPVHGLGVVCESTCPIESALPDLRIMAFSIREDEGYFIITMVRSDSTIRVSLKCQSSQASLIKNGRCINIATVRILSGLF
jgi:WD40 repeat protein